MESNPIVSLSGVSHRYRAGRQALENVGFEVQAGEIFGFLGPNGSGKTTLFRLLATLVPLQEGRVTLAGLDLASEPEKIRAQLGIVFQSPSLDKKLTIAENLRHQGHLYGLQGVELQRRSALLLERFGLTDRRQETAEKLSGGLQRRVEIAKSLLHRPRILLLDEPSTGLDPGARRDLWHHLRSLQAEQQVTILLTTHLMDEADQCDRLLVLDQGRKITVDTPAILKSQVSGTVISVRTRDPQSLRDALQAKLGLVARVVEGALRLEWQPRSNSGTAAEWTGKILQEFSTQIEAITLSQPTSKTSSSNSPAVGFTQSPLNELSTAVGGVSC